MKKFGEELMELETELDKATETITTSLELDSVRVLHNFIKNYLKSLFALHSSPNSWGNYTEIFFQNK